VCFLSATNIPPHGAIPNPTCVQAPQRNKEEAGHFTVCMVHVPAALEPQVWLQQLSGYEKNEAWKNCETVQLLRRREREMIFRPVDMGKSCIQR
jgi:hypothetical protein